MLTLKTRLKWINRDVSDFPFASLPNHLYCVQTGRRSDSAHAYVHATRSVHSNLYLACNTKVDKVIIENGRAVAVQTVYVIVAVPSSSLVADNK
jgi:hypothetical protein